LTATAACFSIALLVASLASAASSPAEIQLESPTTTDGAATAGVIGAASSVMRTNEPPTAAGDTLTADSGRAVTIDVLEDDVDSDGDTVSVTSAEPAAEHGTVSCSPTGDCTYTPERGHSGRDSFRYWISDGYGGSSSADVEVLVQAECTPLTHTLSNGDTETTDGAVSVKVDGLGGFGANVVSPGGEARFNPPEPTVAAGTVFSSNLDSSSANELRTDAVPACP
jgi:Big-like domain-containing protein